MTSFYFTCPRCGTLNGPLSDISWSCGNWLCEVNSPKAHQHEWKIYRGLNVVEKFCSCGEKQAVDWRELKDDSN